jgi:cysteine-rich repeat protein
MDRTFALVVAIAAVLSATCDDGCGQRAGDADLQPDVGADADVDADGGDDAGADADVDADVDADATHDDADADEGLPRVEHDPQCGDGNVDDGEECDDRNRLDGDGCDWLCRLGDGAPPPEPDPEVSPYEPVGDPVRIAEETDFSPLNSRLPLVWTGSELATVIPECLLGPSRRDEPLYQIRFHRFDGSGAPIDSGWTYPVWAWTAGSGVSADLVWTGESFGLFYIEPDLSTTPGDWDGDSAVMFLSLDAEGKPLGEPVVVVAGWETRAVAADRTGPGYVITWKTLGETRPGPGCMGGDDINRSLVWIGLVGVDGSMEGMPGPVLLEDNGEHGSLPDVAAGPDGFGVTLTVDATPGDVRCSTRFVRVTDDLVEVTESGTLSESAGGDVLYSNERFATTWIHGVARTDGPAEVCTARFLESGDLEGPPVCNGVFPGAESCSVDSVRLAAGEGGLATFFSIEHEDAATMGGRRRSLRFHRLDEAGREVMAPLEVIAGSATEVYVGQYAISWAGSDRFAGLYQSQRPGDGGIVLFLQMFGPAE